MLLIGSRAAKYHLAAFRTPRDYDFIATEEEIAQFKADNNIVSYKIEGGFHHIFKVNAGRNFTVEIENAPEGSTSRYLLENASGPSGNLVGCPFYTDYQVATPEQLIFLKRSHLYFPIHWFKHIRDYHQLKNYLNAPSLDRAMISQRIKETKERLGKLRTPSLKQTKGEFFGKSNKVVEAIFDHDQIHQVMAYNDVPVYTMMQTEEVFCDENLWNELSQEHKIQAVQEEAYVIALERILLPWLFENKEKVYAADKINPDNAFNWAVMRICTTLTSGWFRRFAIENWPAVMQYDDDYFVNFESAYIREDIRPIRTLSPLEEQNASL